MRGDDELKANSRVAFDQEGASMTAPGWYPDPEAAGALRWWDGARWTAHQKAARTVVVPIRDPSPPQPPLPLELDRSPAAASPDSVGALRAEYDRLRSLVIELSDIAMLQEIGIYESRHRLATAAAYKERLGEIRREIRDLAKGDRAVTGAKRWAINGSADEGAKMVKDMSKLMLRAYNNEADNVVQTMKPYALDAALKRLESSKLTISKLGARMEIAITDEYHRVRVTELELTADYLVKVAEEKEAERERRERERDEEIAQRQMKAAREKLEKEQKHYANALPQIRATGDVAAIAAAEAKLTEIAAAITGVAERAANIRAGYVYIISNLGAFGERVVKIGLTRREDPEDRVYELGDASVPFRFDIHATIFSDDAVSLESKLHERFAAKAVNLLNRRREFFFVTPAEVRDAVLELGGNILEFADVPEADEWRQSEAIRAKQSAPGRMDGDGR